MHFSSHLIVTIAAYTVPFLTDCWLQADALRVLSFGCVSGRVDVIVAVEKKEQVLVFFDRCDAITEFLQMKSAASAMPCTLVEDRWFYAIATIVVYSLDMARCGQVLLAGVTMLI